MTYGQEAAACLLIVAAGPVHPRGPATSKMAFSLAAAWSAMRTRTAAVKISLRCSMWAMPGFKLLAEHGGATRAGANENAGPFAQFVPPHLRDRHAQTTRQERQKKAATRDGFKCIRRMFLR